MLKLYIKLSKISISNCLKRLEVLDPIASETFSFIWLWEVSEAAMLGGPSQT